MIDQNRDGLIDVNDLRAIYEHIGKIDCEFLVLFSLESLHQAVAWNNNCSHTRWENPIIDCDCAINTTVISLLGYKIIIDFYQIDAI